MLGPLLSLIALFAVPAAVLFLFPQLLLPLALVLIIAVPLWAIWGR